jgi:hypothetical protein
MVIEFVLCIRVAGSLPYACGFVRTTCGSVLLENAPFRRAPSLSQAREENARSPLIRPTIALKVNGALSPRDRDLIFSNDVKKAVLFVGDPSREKDSRVERQKIP